MTAVTREGERGERSRSGETNRTPTASEIIAIRTLGSTALPDEPRQTNFMNLAIPCTGRDPGKRFDD
jgi:hypothetical protein